MSNQSLKDQILLKALPHVPFDGWTWDVMTQAAGDKDIASAVFPGRIPDVLSHFANYLDRQMMDALPAPNDTARVRDKIADACMARYNAMNTYKEQERLALQYWARPFRKYQGGKILWRTADKIWIYAGDTATDYNRYTKRGLLCGVLGATMLVWLNDDTKNLSETEQFLNRRIDDVLKIGKPIGRFMEALPCAV